MDKAEIMRWTMLIAGSTSLGSGFSEASSGRGIGQIITGAVLVIGAVLAGVI